MTLLYDKTGGTQAIVHLTGTETVVIVGNNSVSNVVTAGDETCLGATITQVWFGCDGGGSWQLARGNDSANSVAAVFTGSGHTSYYAGGTVLSIDQPGENLYVTLDGSSNGYIMIDLSKESRID